MDYLKIITANWSLFKDNYSDPDKEVYKGTAYGNSQKEKATHWFSALNEIRKKVSHPERAAVTESEYKFLIKLSSWLLPNISDLENQNTEDIIEENDDELNE